MGLSLEFYAGNAQVIATHFDAIDFEGLRDGTFARAYADFSLHLSPYDLDLLSEVVAQQSELPLIPLSGSLQPLDISDDEHGADVVSPAWVRMIAATNIQIAQEITVKWIDRVGREYGNELEVTPEAIEAVEALIQLCRIAQQEKLDVVHTWYL